MAAKETLIVIADASGAHFYKTSNRGASVEPAAPSLPAPPNPRSRDQMTDKPGRAFSSTTPGRSAMEPRADPHKRAEDEFSRALAQQIDGTAAQYGGILLFAPPTFLGTLRKHLGQAAAAKIVREVDKDLMKADAGRIREHVRETLFPD